MSVTVVNLQRKHTLATSKFREFSLQLLNEVREADGKEIAVAFVSDRRMTELNNFFRGKDTTTDVLSFPHEPDEFVQSAGFSPSSSTEQAEACILNDNFLGDIVISVEQAAKQAEANRLTLEGEIKQLILHGLLHLCGYDHDADSGEMNAYEIEIRERLGI